MSASEIDPFAGSAGLPSISFATKDQYGNMTSKPVGTRIGGKVIKAPALVQSRNFTTKQAEFWPDGNAKMSVVVDLLVDGVEMSLWVKKPSALFKAFGEAKGEAVIKPGDSIYVTLIGFGKPEADKAPAKLYKVDYIPGDPFTAAPPVPTGAATPAPPSAAATPAAVAEPVLSNGFTASALRAGGWTEAQIGALSAPQAVPAPQAAPAPPAAPAAVSEAPAATAAELTEREQKLATMTDADKALLGL